MFWFAAVDEFVKRQMFGALYGVAAVGRDAAFFLNGAIGEQQCGTNHAAVRRCFQHVKHVLHTALPKVGIIVEKKQILTACGIDQQVVALAEIGVAV